MPPARETLQTAAAYVTRNVPTAAPDERAGDARMSLLGRDFECADDVAVIDRGSLVGLVPIERLLAADPGATIAALMDSDPPSVSPSHPQEAVAWKMIRHGESSMPVVDGDEFIGLIPPHAMLSVLLAEHDEDVARLGGYLASTRRARQAAEENVRRRLLHRLPWLVVGLIGAMVSAILVGAFEEEIEKNVLLALFVPAVVYMADAVGTQTEAVLIRAMSAGVSVRDIVRRELAAGAAMGAVVSAAFFPFALVVWGDSAVAASVALALFASCSIATLVAMILPWLFQRLGYDPAFGSGPLATVIQDLLSIAVYFAIAVPLAT